MEKREYSTEVAASGLNDACRMPDSLILNLRWWGWREIFLFNSSGPNYAEAVSNFKAFELTPEAGDYQSFFFSTLRIKIASDLTYDLVISALQRSSAAVWKVV